MARRKSKKTLAEESEATRAVALGLLRKCYTESVNRRVDDIRIPNPFPPFDNLDSPWPLYQDLYDGKHWNYIKSMAAWKSRPVTNKVFQAVEAYTTFLTDNRPSITILPVEPFDFQLAEVIQAGIMKWWDLEDMDIKIARAVKHSRIFGLGWFYIYYDEDTSRVRCRVVHPSCVLVDPDVTADDWDSATYIIYKVKRQVGELKKQFPSADFTEFDPKWTADRGMTLNDYGRTSSDDFAATNPAQSCWVYQLWIRDTTQVEWKEETENEVFHLRGKKYPRGRVITFAGGLVLDDRENPYKHAEFPFIPVHAYPVPGKFYGPGDAQQIAAPQFIRNRMSQMIVDQTLRSGGAMIILGAAAEVNPHKISNAPVQIIPARDPNAVRVEKFPAPSRHVIEYILSLDKDIDDLVGMHDISKGASNPGNRTALEIQITQESDKTRVRMAARNLTWAVKKIGNQVLKNLAQWEDWEWWVRIANKTLTPADETTDEIPPEGIVPGFENDDRYTQWRYEKLDGKMLRKKNEKEELTNEIIDYDLEVQDSSTLPNQQSERRQMAIDLFQMGVIDDQAVLEILQIPGYQGILARKKEMAKNQPLPQPPGAPQMGPSAPPQGMPPEMMQMMMQQQMPQQMPPAPLPAAAPPEQVGVPSSTPEQLMGGVPSMEDQAIFEALADQLGISPQVLMELLAQQQMMEEVTP